MDLYNICENRELRNTNVFLAYSEAPIELQCDVGLKLFTIHHAYCGFSERSVIVLQNVVLGLLFMMSFMHLRVLPKVTFELFF